MNFNKLIKNILYSDLNEQVLFYQGELTEQKLKRSEIKSLLYQLNNRFKDQKFERERILVRVQDFHKIRSLIGQNQKNEKNTYC
ncbi:unnamed protein product [Paramecium primaurelia]|uniref:Uncharacterized protein n=1 Tax=Paramecium primaurelia TaxID=5886 RepID=A0A8S1QR62_PARPR|nr:unnamed protein product [Paramecium primaurelia]